MTDEILKLINKRREAKAIDNKRYKKLQREIQKKMKEAKEHWLNEKFSEIEKLQEVHDSFNMQKI